MAYQSENSVQFVTYVIVLEFEHACNLHLATLENFSLAIPHTYFGTEPNNYQMWRWA